MSAAFWDTTRGRALNGLILFAVLLIVWEAAVRVSGIKPFLLPAPTAVAAQLAAKPGWYLHHAYYTLYETLLGFALAVTVGVLMAVGVVYSRFVERTLFMLLVTMNAVPKIAIAPLFIIWLGTGMQPKVAVALLVALFPIVIDTVLGLRSVDPEMLDLAKSLRASRLQVLWKIRAPCALPGLFSGLKIGISLAFIGAIVGEFIAAENGLGFVVVSSQASFSTDQMFAAIVLLVILGLVLFYLIEALETVLLPWHVSRRRGGGGKGHF
jgi:NitT/TauT family transport system permease protein